MKKNLLLLTGIVFLITILIAGGFTPADDPDSPPTYTDEVTIFLKAYEEGEEMKLLMYDSKNETPIKAEEHVADVGPGTKVVWRRAKDSGIRSIKKVSSKEVSKGPIFDGDATTIILSKRRRIKVADNAPIPSAIEESFLEQYEITFKDKKHKKDWPTDPYLRIRSD